MNSRFAYGHLRRAAALLVSAMVAALLAGGLPLAFAAPAHADVNPAPGVPQTASAKSLPTWQINGVGWQQVIVGNTVYVTGNFTTARPPGVPVGGAGEITVGHLLAYDIRTGTRISTFNHILNAQGRSIAKSPDGTRIYVGGDFTTVDGQARGHIAAFDVATGNLVPGFAPNVNGVVRAITVSPSTVYYGGSFSSVNSVKRGSLAASSVGTGALTSWAPGADGIVWALVVTPNGSRVIIGGQFTNLSGVPVYGSGAVDAATGAVGTWLANNRIRNSVNGAISTLTTDGTTIYGTGWAFGTGATFEGSFAANPDDGSLRWVYDCLGDTYSGAPIGDVFYSVGHSHDCTAINEFPDTNPRVRWQNSLAFTTAPAGTITRTDAYGWDYTGLPSPSLLHWFPAWSNGSFTGQYQAGWSISGNSDYVTVAGEFPYVNGAAQQGLVRFGIGATADLKSGPLYDTKPPRPVPSTTAGTVRPGVVRVAFGSAWDKDNEELSYQVTRDGVTKVGAPFKVKTNYWTLPNLAVTDTSVPAGKHTYRVRITDPNGNALDSPVSNSVSVSSSIGAYGDTIIGDNPVDYWRLGEAGGNIALDGGSAGHDLSTRAGLTFGADGAVTGNTAVTLDGATGYAATAVTQPGPNSFSAEAWFKTTTTTGGKILGFGNNADGLSNNYDRHVYMTDSGQIAFGVYSGGTQVITTPASYNDGAWHQVVASMGADGMSLVIDGVRVGKIPSVTAGQSFDGYWRIGGDSLGGWPAQPTSSYFAGSVDEVAVYDTPLSLSQVRAHYVASGRTVAVPPVPTDSYGAKVYASSPDFFWRMDETSGTMAVDTMGQTAGKYTGGVTLGQPGPLSGNGNTSVTFNGVDGNLTSASTFDSPSVYSEELWFNTTTTRGGKLIGFGTDPTGNSSGYDRHVWMLNDGRLRFGTWTGQPNIAESSASFNDGSWHHMVATQGPDGMKLYVDGTVVGTDPQTSAQPYTGYWRVGGDTHWGDADSYWIDARIDEVAVYSKVLSLADVQDHYGAGGGTVVNQSPTATFTKSMAGLKLTADGTGSSDPDGTIASYAWNFGDGTTSTDPKPVHTYTTGGSYTVSLTVTDNRGATGATSAVVTLIAPPTDTYGAAVAASAPDLYWRLGESGGPMAADATGNNPGAYFGNGVTYGVDGAVPGGDKAAAFDGTTTGVGATQPVTNPTVYSEELWFKTTTTAGGKLIGFGDRNSDTSSNYDRHVYMLASGQLQFGVWTGQSNIVGSSASYNDGTWHHMVATQGPDGMALYVDGDLVGTNPQTAAQPYTGYWRVGGDTSWADSNFFAGSIDEVAVYSSVLAAATVRDHFTKGGGQLPNVLPTAAFDSSMAARTVSVDASASTDSDGSIASYAWDFGDGATGTGKLASHRYTAGGTYSVKLVVTDNRGGTATSTKSVVVPDNAAPTAAFTSRATGLTASVDGSGSADSDGTVASYAWDFGDGGTGTGATATHTYATGGTYQVKLTVTDNDGATGAVTKAVLVKSNAAPTAAFTSTATGMTASVDGSGSADSDGTVASYAWDFGDGGTGTGATATHSYAADGTYQVKLTVTDNGGATGSVTKAVVVKSNAAPTAAFTSTVSDLKVTLDGSGSSDTDGTVASYAWDFGDGGTGTGATATHTYATGGTYQVKLTVTDNGAATGTATRAVSVNGPLAKDTFARTLTTGLGAADLGGAWALSGSTSAFSVNGGWGNLAIAAPGKGLAAALGSVSSTDTDVQLQVKFNKAPTGGGYIASVVGRGGTADGYRTKVTVASSGAMTVALVKVVGGVETALTSKILPGATYTAGTSYTVRMQTWGTTPTALRARVWATSATEPITWLVSSTDSATGLQAAGGVGIVTYLSGSATNAPVTVSITGLLARLTGN
ncbi:PKD domain-containing protein [Pedococcus sp. KACC 23699]|uniref:PKD domain-containing protein n=1 Tax=Pedococcus sp. KACC 23699 TaxID=3149228 RepID=A0AAU7JW61_9MICO